MLVSNSNRPGKIGVRRKGRRFGLWCCIAAALTFASPCGASTSTTQAYQDWSLSCAAGGGDTDNEIPPCEIVQIVRPHDSDTPILQLAFAYNARRNAYGVYLVLPKDTRLSGGLVVRLDGVVDLDYQVARCDADACISEKLINDGEMTLFKDAGKGFVAMVKGDGTLRSIPLSFTGFSEALAAMVSLNEKWAKQRPHFRNMKGEKPKV